MNLLHQVAVGVVHFERAVRFYGETLALREMARFDFPGLAFFDLGGTRLLLEKSEEAEGGTSVVYLRVESIDREHARLLALGVDFTSPPHLIHTDAEGVFGEPGVEEWMAFFVDPDGNSLALVERRFPAHA